MVIQESAAGRLKDLTEEYTRRFEPASLQEEFLVETLAICEWRSRRCLKRLIAAQSKRAPKPVASKLFVVPKLSIARRSRG